MSLHTSFLMIAENGLGIVLCKIMLFLFQSKLQNISYIISHFRLNIVYAGIFSSLIILIK